MPYFIEENPYGRRNPRKRRNPSNPVSKLGSTVKGWSQGVSMEQVIGGGVGLIATTIIPPKIIRTAPVTVVQKLAKVALSAGIAMAAGMLARRVSPKAAQAVVIGGLAGVVYTSIITFTNFIPGANLTGNVQRVRAISSGRVAGSAVVSPAMSRENETVSLITP